MRWMCVSRIASITKRGNTRDGVYVERESVNAISGREGRIIEDIVNILAAKGGKDYGRINET
jgi:hypothetical protein